jgi:hypothetical protein
MKILWGDKDGGPESKSWVWGIEIKSMFSILVLKFGRGSREAFHNHAFNAISWLVRGMLVENVLLDFRSRLHEVNFYRPSWLPIITRRTTFHMVSGMADASWAITFRGPWVAKWNEFLPAVKRFITLTHGRREC